MFGEPEADGLAVEELDVVRLDAVGEGSTFRVLLPLAAAPADAGPPNAALIPARGVASR